MTIRSTPKEPTERDGNARFILESHANTGPRATGDDVLQHGSSQHTVPWQNGGRQKDQLPETNPKGGGQAHPSMQGRRSIQSGDEPSWRRPSDRTTLRLSASHDPSGSVFSSLVQEQADIRSDDQSCNLASFFLDNPSNHPHHSTAQNGSGGACRDRTDDPLLAKQVLSQLS